VKWFVKYLLHHVALAGMILLHHHVVARGMILHHALAHVAQAGMTTVLLAQASLALAGQALAVTLALAGQIALAAQATAVHQAGIKYVK